MLIKKNYHIRAKEILSEHKTSEKVFMPARQLKGLKRNVHSFIVNYAPAISASEREKNEGDTI